MGRLRVLILLPLLVAGVALAANVKLGWDANSEPDIAGYRLYYGVVSAAYNQTVDVGTNITATASNLQSGLTYFFAVTAYNTSGLESEFSNELSLTIASKPPTPTKFTISGGSK